MLRTDTLASVAKNQTQLISVINAGSYSNVNDTIVHGGRPNIIFAAILCIMCYCQMLFCVVYYNVG